jgi:predicted nucleic acid-binding protein
MNAVDTNVLIYVHDPRNPTKQQIASELVANLREGALVWQVACEYLAASRKAALGLSYERAIERVRRIGAAWTTVLPTWSVMDRMHGIRSRYSLSIWDGLLVATCLEGGVHRLYTEDFDAYREIDSLEIINPFRELK